MSSIFKAITNRKIRKEEEKFRETRNQFTQLIFKNRAQFGNFQEKLRRNTLGMARETHHERAMTDFQSYYKFNDPLYGSGTGGNSTSGYQRPSFQELEAASLSTVGPGKYFTTRFANRCLRNGFDFYNWNGDLVKKMRIMKQLYQAKFFTAQMWWVAYELIYGISFLLKYWSSHDKYENAPPKKPPLSYRAFPPTILNPANITDSNMLWEDDEKWEFYGGKYNNFKIHKDRVEVLITRPCAYDWVGYSILEPIFLTYTAYMNLIVNGIKMIAKYGNLVAAFNMSYANPSLATYNEYKALVESMKASMTFILGKDEKMEFIETKIGSGLYEFAEVLKEDMAAGTGLPLNQVYGRADGGGLAGAGALISKQGELETMSDYQADLADNYWVLFNRYWDVDDLFVKFRLDSQKSDRARYEEELLQWDIEFAKANVEATKLQTLVQATQFQMQLENPELMFGGPADSTGGNVPDSIGGNNGGSKPGQGNSPNALGKIAKATSDFILKQRKSMDLFRARRVDENLQLDFIQSKIPNYKKFRSDKNE